MERSESRTYPWSAALLCAPLLALAGCQPAGQGGGEVAAVDTAAVMASLDSLRSAYEQAVADGDWQRLGGMVTEDAVIVQAGTAPWDSMLAAASEAGAPFPPGSSLEIETLETRVLAPDWAYDMGRGMLTWTPEGAAQARTLRGTYLVLLHRTEDGWKVHREVESSRPPPGQDR